MSEQNKISQTFNIYMYIVVLHFSSSTWDLYRSLQISGLFYTLNTSMNCPISTTFKIKSFLLNVYVYKSSYFIIP